MTLVPGDIFLGTPDKSPNRTAIEGALPKMRLNPAVKTLFDFKYEDFTLEGYDPHPHIAAKVAV